MGRNHGVAGRIEQDALQGSVVLGPRRDVMGSLLGQSPLHGLKQLAVDQWRLRARANLTFIENLADVEAIVQEVEQGALREGHAAARAAVRQLVDLCSYIALAKLEHQPVDAAEREIPTKDHVHQLGLPCHDGELAILEFISQRYGRPVDVLRTRYTADEPSCGGVRRQDTQGGQAGRSYRSYSRPSSSWSSTSRPPGHSASRCRR